jgi:hypothetical protein
MVLPKDMVVYQINMTQVPEEERPELEELIEKDLESKLLELKNDKELKLREISYITNIQFGSKYRWSDKKNLILQVHIRADCDNYKVLTLKINRIFSDLSIFSDGLYTSHSIERYKDFETLSFRSRPAWV